jgi:hypothetical protein
MYIITDAVSIEGSAESPTISDFACLIRILPCSPTYYRMMDVSRLLPANNTHRQFYVI